MRVLVDSSVWIDFFRRNDTSQRWRLRKMATGGEERDLFSVTVETGQTITVDLDYGGDDGSGGSGGGGGSIHLIHKAGGAAH